MIVLTFATRNWLSIWVVSVFTDCGRCEVWDGILRYPVIASRSNSPGSAQITLLMLSLPFKPMNTIRAHWLCLFKYLVTEIICYLCRCQWCHACQLHRHRNLTIWFCCKVDDIIKWTCVSKLAKDVEWILVKYEHSEIVAGLSMLPCTALNTNNKEKTVKITRKVVEGTRGPFYTIGRSSLPAADTLRRRRRRKKTQNVNPKAQHRFCTMV